MATRKQTSNRVQRLVYVESRSRVPGGPGILQSNAHAHTHTHMHTPTPTCIDTHTCAQVHSDMHRYTHRYTQMHTDTHRHTCTRTHTYTHTRRSSRSRKLQPSRQPATRHAHTHTCTHTHTHTHRCIHTRTQMHTYTHTDAHIHALRCIHAHAQTQMHTHPHTPTLIPTLLFCSEARWGGAPTPKHMATATTTVFKATREHTAASRWAAMRAMGIGEASQPSRPRCCFEFETFGTQIPTSFELKAASRTPN